MTDLLLDKDGNVTDINDQYCDFLGTTKERQWTFYIKYYFNSKMIDIVNKGYSERFNS